MPAAAATLPTWEQVTSDPRYQGLSGGDRLGVLDSYDALIKQQLGEAYNPDDVEPYLTAERERIAAEGQGTLSTAGRSFMTGIGQVATGAVQGLGSLGEDLSQTINDATGLAGLGDAAVNLVPGMAGYRAAAPFAEAAQQGIEGFYAPDAVLNPISATIGGGAGQAIGMLPAAVAGPAGPLALGGLQGYQQGRDQATDLGIENPLGRLALGAGFGIAETAMNRLTGIESGPMTQGLKDVVNRIAGQGLKTIASEAIEEPLTGAAQDAMSLGAGYLAGTEQAKLDPLMPNAPGYLERRGLEALGGAAGGAVFAGISKLAQPKMGQAGLRPEAGGLGNQMPPPLPAPNGEISRTGIARAARARLSELESAEMGQAMLGKDGEIRAGLGRRLSPAEQAEKEFLMAALANADAPDHEKLAAGYGYRLKQPITATTGTELPSGNEGASDEEFDTVEATVRPAPPAQDFASANVRNDLTDATVSSGMASSVGGSTPPTGTTETKTLWELAASDAADKVFQKAVAREERVRKQQELDQLEANVRAAHTTFKGAVTPEEVSAMEERIKQLRKELAADTADGTTQPGLRPEAGGLGNQMPPAPSLEPQAAVPSIDNIGTKFAPPQVRAVPVIPDSPLGKGDSLDFLNEHPIALSRSDTGGELDWQEKAGIPRYYRPFIASETGRSIDKVVDAAYEANLIKQPTADALMARVNEDINARRLYRVEGRKQTRDLLVREKQEISFDKAQNKLERKTGAQAVPTDALVTGDRMTIDGEEVVVREVQSDEDGYPIKVVLEDGKKFGVQEFNPQTKTGIFVDEFLPRARKTANLETATLLADYGQKLAAMQQARGTTNEARLANEAADLRDRLFAVALEAPTLAEGEALIAKMDSYAGNLERGRVGEAQAEAFAKAYNQRMNDRPFSKAGPQRGLGRGLGALLGSPGAGLRPEAGGLGNQGEGLRPEAGGLGNQRLQASSPKPQAQLPALSRDLLTQAEAASQDVPGYYRGYLDLLFTQARRLLSPEPNVETRKTDAVTVPQALERIAAGENPIAIANRWSEHRNDVLTGKTTEGSPFVAGLPLPGAAVAPATIQSGSPADPEQQMRAAYAQLDRTGQGYVRIPDLARAAGLTPEEMRGVLGALDDAGQAYLTPADEPRNIPESDRPYLVNGPSGKALYVTLPSEARTASQAAPKPLPAKTNTLLVSIQRLQRRITEAVREMSKVWDVALPGNTRTLMFAPYPITSDRVNGDIDHATLEIRIKDQNDRTTTHGAVYHELAHAFQFIANRALGRDTHDNRIIQPLLNFLRTTKSGAALELAAADVESAIDGRLRTIAKQQKALARWQADPRPVSAKGPAPVVPKPIKLSEEDAFVLYLQKPHEQFARAVHAATLYLTGEPLNAHADPGWEQVMAFDEAELQVILRHVGSFLAQHLPRASAATAPVSAGGFQLSAGLEGNATAGNNLGSTNGSPGQAPGPEARAASQGAPESAAVNAPPLKPSQAVPLRPEFGGAAADYAPFEDQAMGDWAERTANALPLEQLADQIQANRWTPVQSEYLLAQAIVRAEAAVRSAKTQADQMRASGLKSRLRAMLDARGTAAGQDLAARRYALAGLRGEIGGLAVDDAVEKGQQAVIDAAVGGSVQPAVKGLQDLTGQASAEATDELAGELEAEGLGLEAEPSTPAEQSRADEEMQRLRQQLTASRNTMDVLTATWQKILESIASVGASKGALMKSMKARAAAIRAARANSASAAANRVQSQGAPAVGIAAPALPATAVEDGFLILIEQGIDSANWRAAMTKILGPQFAGQLDTLYAQALGMYQQAMAAEAAAINQRVRAKATKQGKGTQGSAAKVVSARFPNLGKMLSQLRPMIAPGLNWKQIFTSTATQQRQWELDTYAAIRQHPALQQLNAEQAKQLTRELSKAWQSKRRTVWKRELNRTLIAAGMAKPKVRAQIEASAPRLLALINLGALDARTFRDAVAKEFGLKSMNDAEVQKVKALAEELQTTPPGVPYRRKAQAFIDGLQDLAGITRTEILQSWWTAAILSGWRTQVDIGLGLLNGVEDIGLASVGRTLRTAKPAAAGRALMGFLGNLPQALGEAAHHLLTGNRSLLKNYDAQVLGALEEGQKTVGSSARALLQRGGWRTIPGWGMEAVARMMTALGHVTTSSTYEGAKWLAIANHPELYHKALTPSAADKAAIKRQARQVLTGGAPPANLAETLAERRYMMELMDQKFSTAEVMAEAQTFANETALEGDPSGLGMLFMKAVNALTVTAPTLMANEAEKENWSKVYVRALRAAAVWAKPLTGTKFARTVSHSINRNMSYVPGIGAIRFGMDAKWGTLKGDKLIGAQILGVLFCAAFKGWWLGDDEEKGGEQMRGIEGGWKDLTSEQKAANYAQGKKPWHLWVKDKQGKIHNVNYQQWGISSLLGALGRMQDLERYKGVTDHTSLLITGLMTGSMAWADKAQLQGLQLLLGADSPYNTTDPNMAALNKLNKYVATLVGGAIPRLFKDVDALRDPTLRRTDHWWQVWAKELPMARTTTSGARLDLFGQEIKLDRGPLSRVYQASVLAPEYQLLGKLNAKGIQVPDPSFHARKVKLANAPSRDMTELEKDRFQREAGKMTKDWLLQTAPQLLQMDPDQAQDMISKRTQLIRAMAVNRAVGR